MIKKYKRDRNVIEAVQWTGINAEEIMRFVGRPLKYDVDIDLSTGYLAGVTPPVCYIEIETFSGVMRAFSGDYIIKVYEGVFYPCRPYAFHAIYSLMEEPVFNNNNIEPRIIAVDFDGTLVKDEFPSIGEPIQEVVDLIKKEKASGSCIILWTCRQGDRLTEAIDWCTNNEISLDAVNDNIPEIIKNRGFNINSRKIYANYYIDDKAINITDLHRII